MSIEKKSDEISGDTYLIIAILGIIVFLLFIILSVTYTPLTQKPLDPIFSNPNPDDNTTLRCAKFFSGQLHKLRNLQNTMLDQNFIWVANATIDWTPTQPKNEETQCCFYPSVMPTPGSTYDSNKLEQAQVKTRIATCILVSR